MFVEPQPLVLCQPHMDTDSFFQIPRRVFLDTNIVNFTLDFGDQIHECADIPDDIDDRTRENIQGLCGIFDTGQRAFWQFAISSLTYREIIATRNLKRRHHLESWFVELWNHWNEMVNSMDNLPSFFEANETRLNIISSGLLDILPDDADRLLICDAIIYNCDCFCTCDYHTIIKYRDSLSDLPLKILTPAEWWKEIKPWAATWL